METIATNDSYPVGAQPLPSTNDAYVSSTDNAINFAKYGAPAALLGLYDTVGSSFGLETEEHIESMKDTLLGGIANYYDHNRTQSAILGELPAMFIPGMAGVRLFRGARTALAGSSFLNDARVASAVISPQTASILMRKLNVMDKVLPARTGALAANLIPARRKLAATAKASAVSNAMLDGLAFEVGVAATMSGSDFLYPEDFTMSDHLAFAALGIAIPGGIEALIARKATNNSLRAAAGRSHNFYNPNNLPPNVLQRTGGHDVNLALIKETERQLLTIADELPTQTSRAEALVGLNATQLNSEARRNINTKILDMQDQFKTLVDKTAREGFRFADGSTPNKAWMQTKPLSPGAFNTLKSMSTEDPYFMLGTRAITDVDPTLNGYAGRVDALAKSNEAEILKLRAKAKKEAAKTNGFPEQTDAWKQADLLEEQNRTLNDLQVLVLEPTGEIQEASMRSLRFYDSVSQGNIRRTPATKAARGSYTATYQRGGLKTRASVSMDDSGLLFFSGAKEPLDANNTARWDKLTTQEQGAVFGIMQHARENFDVSKAGLDFVDAAIIPKNSHWTRLEYVHEILRGNKANSEYFDISAFGSLEALQFEIFAQKAAGVAKELATKEKSLFSNLMQDLSVDDIFYKYNLGGRDHIDQLSPIADLITKTAKIEGLKTADEFRAFFKDWDTLINLIKSDTGLTMLSKTPYLNADPAQIVQLISKSEDRAGLFGRATRVGHTKAGGKIQYNKAVGLVKESVPIENKSSEYLIEALANRRAAVIGDLLKMADRSAEPNYGAGTAFVGELARVLNDPNFAGSATAAYRASRDVESLYEFDKFLGGVISQKVHKIRDIPAFAALEQVVSTMERRTNEMISAIFKTEIALGSGRSIAPVAVFSEIRSSSNKASMQLFNMYVQARRTGWRLEPQASRLPDTATEPGKQKWGFKLSSKPTDVKANEALWRATFGSDFAEQTAKGLGDTESLAGHWMPNINAVNRPDIPAGKVPLMLDQLAFETAETLATLGKTTLRNGNVLRKQLGLVVTPERNWWVPPKNFKESGQNKVTFIQSEPSNPQLRILNAGSAAEMRQLVDDELKSLHDRGFTAAREIPHKDIEKYHDLQDHAFADLIDVTDTLRQSKTNRGASGTARFEDGNHLDSLVETITGQLTSISKRTRGLMYEDVLQHARQVSTLSDTQAAQSQRNIYADFANTILGGKELSATTPLGKLYNTIESTFDTFMQQTVDEWRAYTTTNKDIWKENTTKDATQMLAEMNKKLAGNSPFLNTVQYVESLTRTKTPTRLKNILAPLNALTSTLALRLLELGHPILNLTSLIATSPAVIRALNKMPDESIEQWRTRTGSWGAEIINGEVATLHPGKLASTAVHRMFNDEAFKARMKEAENLGLFKQSVSEMVEATLDPTGKNLSGTQIKKVVDFLSKPSDGSEVLSRRIAHAMGLHIAESIGIKSAGNANVYAHKLANEIIGDYRPSNKPQIFQGTVGMPLGLFQTFMWNYMHRIFGYVENKQWRALATQYGMQASLFGAQTVPGYQQFSETFATNYDGSSTPADTFREAFGNEISDIFFYGTLSNIPKIVGLDGIALYTRGDANVTRVPTIASPQDSAVAQLAVNTYGMVKDSLSMFKNGGQFSVQQMAEITARYSINRPFKSMMEWVAGVSTDRSGQLINDDTRDVASIAARLIGSKPFRESKATEANYRNRTEQFKQRNIRERLRGATRSMMRGGSFDEGAITEAFQAYMLSGGNPAYFGPWLREQMAAGLLTKTDRSVMEYLNDFDKMSELSRLTNMGLLPDGDPEFSHHQ